MNRCKHIKILGIPVFYGWVSIGNDIFIKKIGFFKTPNGDYRFQFILDYKIER